MCGTLKCRLWNPKMLCGALKDDCWYGITECKVEIEMFHGGLKTWCLLKANQRTISSLSNWPHFL